MTRLARGRHVLILALVVAALSFQVAAQDPRPPLPPGLSYENPKDPTVTFNVRSLKYHCPSCSAARHCTKSCVNVRRSEAVTRGGVRCKLCGGSCSR